MTKFPFCKSLTTAILIGSSAASGHAAVKMPAIFGDHMVLQEGAKLPIWGLAAPDEKVTVTFAGETGSAVTGADGTWRVDLPAVAQSDKGQVLTVAGSNTLTFQDVLVGDVWVASGQSNMEYGMDTEIHGPQAVPQATDPEIRLFFVPSNYPLEPQKDMAPVHPESLQGKWQICTPQNLGVKWGGHAYSAVAYYFARAIRKATGHPVGMIGSYLGGTPAQAWTSLSGLKQEPSLAHFVDAYQKIVDDYPQAKAAYPAQLEAFKTAYKQWSESGGDAWTKAMADWNVEAEKARAAGQPVPPQPTFAQPKPMAPKDPTGQGQTPSILFNGMISPLIPFAIKGAIWYQGESNAKDYASGQEYAVLFKRLITDWREKWGEGNFPFLFVQLPNYGQPSNDPTGVGSWRWLREAQLDALALPNTGMAVTIDVGDPTLHSAAPPNMLHPPDKLDIGERLALAALHLAYGKDIVSSGPIYDKMSIEGNKIRLTFKHSGSGLALGVPPWTPSGTPPPQPTELTGFAIAGADQKFVWAQATFDGNAVVVSSAQVPNPVAVRYDFTDIPHGDLYNKEGLPASPFRTDTWSN